MKQSSHLLYLLALVPQLLLSQVTINGKLAMNKPVEGMVISLGKYTGSDFKLIDSVKVLADSIFSFKYSTSLADGVYELQIHKTIGMPLIVTSKNKDIRLTMAFMENGTPKLPMCDMENQAAGDLLYILSNYTALTNDALGKKAKVICKDSSCIPELNKYIKTLDSLQVDFNAKLETLRNYYPGTYVAEVFCNILKEQLFSHKLPGYKAAVEAAWMQQHFFDAWNFGDARIISNPLITERYYYYLVNYSQTTDEGFTKCVDSLMKKASANAAVKDYTLTYLTNIFLERGPQSIVDHIYDRYIENCSANLPDRTMKLMSQVRNFKTGNIAPDITSFTPENKKISLDSLVKNKNIVLVYFWASWCSTCQAEIADVIAIYEKYKDKGFRVLAYSIDDKRDEWLKAIAGYKPGWINVSDLKGFASEAVKTYFIFSTPTYFLLDAQGKVVSRNATKEQLDSQVAGLVGK